MSSPELDEFIDAKERIFGWKVPGSKYAPRPHVPNQPQRNPLGGFTREATVDEIEDTLVAPRRPLLKQGVFLVTDHGIFPLKAK